LPRVKLLAARAIEPAEDRGQFRLVLLLQRLDPLGGLTLDLLQLRFTLGDGRFPLGQRRGGFLLDLLDVNVAQRQRRVPLRDDGFALCNDLPEQDRIIGKFQRFRTIHDGRGCIAAGVWGASG
jgi:hypothetical protein